MYIVKTINNFVFRGNQRRRLNRETTKLRNLNQNRLSMVVVVMLPPVEMRLQKKWKRRWAAEPGVCAVLALVPPPPLFRHGFVPGRCTVLLPAGLHKASQMRWGIFPSWQEARGTVVSDATWAGETRSLRGGMETRSGCLSRAELQHRAFPQSIF